MGCSIDRDFGSRYGAGVILPKMLLSAAAPNLGKSGGFDDLLRETYEEPHLAEGAPESESQLQQLENVLRFPPADFARLALGMESADQLSIYVAKQLMAQSAPSLLWITLHDIDIAHSGAYSLYIDGIQRTDRLCVEIWNHIQSNPELYLDQHESACVSRERVVHRLV